MADLVNTGNPLVDAGIGSAVGGGLMGGINGIGGMLGIGKPSLPPIISPYTAATAQNALGQTQLNSEQQQAFLQQLQAQNGTQNQSNVFNQLNQVAQGQGPNPAQAMLANATGANVAQQAALMAGQRGAGANVGLMARQAAMQGANTQQQAAGQGAQLQAQQSLGALNQMGGIAGQQVGQQQQALSGLGNQYLNTQNSINNAIAGVNTANVAATTPINAENAKAQNNAQAGLISGIGQALPLLLMAKGGEVSLQSQEPRSFLYKASQPGFTHDYTMKMATGGKVPALVSPGEKYLPPADAKAVAEGRKDPMSAPTIPGEAKVKGDSLKNDTIPMTLEEGGCVIPRSVLESKDPHKAAAKFVAEHLSKMKAKR
jgi:hypothetical protein